jgi:hypothetical protein
VRHDRRSHGQHHRQSASNQVVDLRWAARVGHMNEFDVRAHEDEKPFFVLLEDDKLITKVSFETDQLLQYASNPPSEADVRLVITVRLRPWEMEAGNIQFG